MTQFMICKSKFDLGRYGKRLTGDAANAEWLIAVAKHYFHPFAIDEVWNIERIDEYCADPRLYRDRLVHIIDDLYGRSEMMVLWYSNDYIDLDVVATREDLMDFITREPADYPFELYILAGHTVTASPDVVR